MGEFTSPEAFINKENLKTQILSRIRRFTRREAIRYFTKFALANLMRNAINTASNLKSRLFALKK